MKYRLLVVLLILTLAFITSCEPDPVSPAEPNIPVELKPIYTREYFGEWIKMDQSETWLIDSTRIKVNGSELSRDVELSKPSDNVISVIDNGITYCLYAVRSASTSITGSTRSMISETSRGDEQLNVIVQNVSDKFDVVKGTVSNDRTFKVDGLVSGNEYKLSIGDTSMQFKPTFDGEDIGTVTVKEGVNFKVTIENTPDIILNLVKFIHKDIFEF